jgi:hypothetical protein
VRRERDSFVEAVLPKLGLSKRGERAFSRAYGSGETTDGGNVYSIERWTVKAILYLCDSDGEIYSSIIETIETSPAACAQAEW